MRKNTGTVDATTGPLHPASGDSAMHPDRRGSNRAFGLVFAAVFALVACWPLFSGAPPRYWALAVALVFLFCAFFWPNSLAVPNRWWTRFGLLLSRIVSPLALGFVYFLSVVPVGLMMRLLGKDNLGLRFDRSAASYWVIRDPKGKPDVSMKNQF